MSVPGKNTSSRDKAPGVEFAIGGIAAAGAGVFTNPIDVVKVRLQLQGELEARGSYRRIYKGTLHAGYIIARHEGLLALQAGLVPALGFQVVLNGIRLGMYNTAKRYDLLSNREGKTDIIKTTLVTGIAGCLGAGLGSPLYLVKTQIQSQSAQSIAVGFQHRHANSIDAFRTLWREGGLQALYRGWHAGMPRLFVGSATQLTTFDLANDWLKSYDVFSQRPILLTFIASAVGGSCVALAVQPFDVVATRLYNQGSNGAGALYTGVVDAFIKALKSEGPSGLYKGVVPTWLRIGPHTVLCLVFYEQLERLRAGAQLSGST